ncbi:MAG: HK97 gp10 family phage protein [Actinomycetota bacterium]
MASSPARAEVENGRALRRQLRQIEGGIADLKVVHKAAAQVVERRAVAIVPRRSGRLAADIRSAGQASGGVVRAGRKSVPYAGPIHFGWSARNISPQPFLYDALDDRRSEVLDAYDKHVAAVIRKHL